MGRRWQPFSQQAVQKETVSKGPLVSAGYFEEGAWGRSLTVGPPHPGVQRLPGAVAGDVAGHARAPQHFSPAAAAPRLPAGSRPWRLSPQEEPGPAPTRRPKRTPLPGNPCNKKNCEGVSASKLRPFPVNARLRRCFLISPLRPCQRAVRCLASASHGSHKKTRSPGLCWMSSTFLLTSGCCKVPTRSRLPVPKRNATDHWCAANFCAAACRHRTWSGSARMCTQKALLLPRRAPRISGSPIGTSVADVSAAVFFFFLFGKEKKEEAFALRPVALRRSTAVAWRQRWSLWRGPPTRCGVHLLGRAWLSPARLVADRSLATSSSLATCLFPTASLGKVIAARAVLPLSPHSAPPVTVVWGGFGVPKASHGIFKKMAERNPSTLLHAKTSMLRTPHGTCWP